MSSEQTRPVASPVPNRPDGMRIPGGDYRKRPGELGPTKVNELGHGEEWKRKVTGNYGEHSKPSLLKKLNSETSASEETPDGEHYSPDEDHGSESDRGNEFQVIGHTHSASILIG